MTQSAPQAESLENRKKRLKFRSWHRGTREMDLLLGSFADQNIQSFGDVELELYERLLENNDPDLYNWITGKEQPPETEKNQVLTLLLAHRFAT